MENPNQFRDNQYINPQAPLPNATAVLVLGIISIVGCFCYGFPGLICSIISLILAGKDTKLYNQNPDAFTAGSYSNMKAGKVCAIVGLILSALYALAIIVFLIIFGFTIFSNPQEFLRNFH